MDPERLAHILAAWRKAVAARSRTAVGGHDWANAEMAVRFWRDEIRDANSRRRGELGERGERRRRIMAMTEQ